MPMPDNPLSPIGEAASQIGGMVLPRLGGLDPRAQQQQQRRAASQAEIQQALDLAQQLQRGSETEGQRITSPWQIVGNMAQALGGRFQMERARQMAEQRQAELAPLLYPQGAGGGVPGGGGGGVGPVGSAEDVGAINQTASDLQIDPRTFTAVMHYESGLDPGNVSDSGKGYPVRGLIGFDPDNVRRYGEPASSIAGQMPQVRQYLLDRGWKPGVYAPDDLPRLYSIINHGSLDRNGNPVLDARDVNGSVGEHVQKIARGSYGPADRFLSGGTQQPGGGGGVSPGGGTPGAPLALTGPQPGMPPQVASVATALQPPPTQPAGGPQASAGASGGPGASQGPGGAARGQLPPGAIGTAPNGRPIFVDPRMVPRRPAMTPDQFRHAMVLSVGDPDMQKRLIQIVQEQQSPIEVPTTWGSVRVHPQDPYIQEPKYTIEKWTEKVGDIEQQRFGIPTGRNIQGMPIVSAPGAASPSQPGAPLPISPAQQPAVPPQQGSPTSQPAVRPPLPAPGGAPQQQPQAPATPPAATPAQAPLVPSAENDPFPDNGTIGEKSAWRDREKIRQAEGQKAAELRAANSPEAIAAAAERERQTEAAKFQATHTPGAIEATAQQTAANKAAETRAGLAPDILKGQAAATASTEFEKKNVEGLMKPIDEARDRGGQKAQDVLNVLGRMRSAYQSAIDKGTPISGGPVKEYMMNLQGLGNEWFPGVNWGNLPESQVVRKSTAELALKQIKEASSRGGTQREFIAMLDNNPGILLSDGGAMYMIDVLSQQAQQDQKIAALANKVRSVDDARNWQDNLHAFYQDPANAIKSPFTGKPLVGDAVKEDEERLKAAKQHSTGLIMPAEGQAGAAASAAKAQQGGEDEVLETKTMEGQPFYRTRDGWHYGKK